MATKHLSKDRWHELLANTVTAEWIGKEKECAEAGDLEGVQRIKFRHHLRLMRGAASMSQKQACKAAGLTIQHWRLLEKAQHLPTDNHLRNIAFGLEADPASFFIAAGRPVPADLIVYSEEAAGRDFIKQLRRCRTFVQLIREVKIIWAHYQFEQTGQPASLKLDVPFDQVLEMVYLYVNEKQQLQLAKDLVKSNKGSIYTLEKHIGDVRKFLNTIEERLRTRLFDAKRLSAIHEKLEALGIFPDHVSRLNIDFREQLERIQSRHEEPITDLDEWFPRLLGSFECLSEFEKGFEEFWDERAKLWDRVSEHYLREKEEEQLILDRLCEAFEMVAKLQRRAETTFHDPQKSLNRIEDALARRKQRGIGRFAAARSFRTTNEKERNLTASGIHDQATTQPSTDRHPSIDTLEETLPRASSDTPSSDSTTSNISTEFQGVSSDLSKRKIDYDQVKYVAARLSSKERLQLSRYLVSSTVRHDYFADLSAPPVPKGKAQDVIQYSPKAWAYDDFFLVCSQNAVDVCVRDRVVFQVRFHPQNFVDSHKEVAHFEDPPVSDGYIGAIQLEVANLNRSPLSEETILEACSQATREAQDSEPHVIANSLSASLPDLATSLIRSSIEAVNKATSDYSSRLKNQRFSKIMERSRIEPSDDGE